MKWPDASMLVAKIAKKRALEDAVLAAQPDRAGDTVFVATTKSAKRVHIERDWSETWCGAKVHVRTGPPSPPTYLCPKCKSAHAAAFGLPSLSRRAKR